MGTGFGFDESCANGKRILAELETKSIGIHQVPVRFLKLLEDEHSLIWSTTVRIAQEVLASYTQRFDQQKLSPADFPGDVCAAFVLLHPLTANTASVTFPELLADGSAEFWAFAGLHAAQAVIRYCLTNKYGWTKESTIPMKVYVNPSDMECLKLRLILNRNGKNKRRDLDSELFMVARKLASNLIDHHPSKHPEQPLYSPKFGWTGDHSRVLFMLLFALFPELSADEMRSHSGKRQTVELVVQLALHPWKLQAAFLEFVYLLETNQITGLSERLAIYQRESVRQMAYWTFDDVLRLAPKHRKDAYHDDIIWPSVLPFIEYWLGEVVRSKNYKLVGKSVPHLESTVKFYRSVDEFKFACPDYGFATITQPSRDYVSPIEFSTALDAIHRSRTDNPVDKRIVQSAIQSAVAQSVNVQSAIPPDSPATRVHQSTTSSTHPEIPSAEAVKGATFHRTTPKFTADQPTHTGHMAPVVSATSSPRVQHRTNAAACSPKSVGPASPKKVPATDTTKAPVPMSGPTIGHALNTAVPALKAPLPLNPHVRARHTATTIADGYAWLLGQSGIKEQTATGGGFIGAFGVIRCHVAERRSCKQYGIFNYTPYGIVRYGQSEYHPEQWNSSADGLKMPEEFGCIHTSLVAFLCTELVTADPPHSRRITLAPYAELCATQAVQLE